jgi:hypothetical protein
MHDTTPAGTRDVPIDWAALEDAVENNAPEVHSYLHLATGEVLRVVDGIADPDMHSRIAASTAYLRLEPVNSRQQYQWMERFVPMVENETLADELLGAIEGKGAFRRFKDALMPWPEERTRWLAFRSERLRVFMEAWLAAQGINPVARTVRPPPIAADAAPSNEPPITQAALNGASAERPRSDAKEALSALAESLGARDLEKVLEFAVFVKGKSGRS